MMKMTKLQRKLTCIFMTTVFTTFLLFLTWTPKLMIRDSEVEQCACVTHLLHPSSKVQSLHKISHSWNSTETIEAMKKSTYIYRNYDVRNPRYVTLSDDHGDYIIEGEGIRCLKEGTENATSKCSCKEGWHGVSCSIPNFVEESQFNDPKRLRLRQGLPRRIIYGICFSVEFEMLEIRMRDMGDLIDLILIVESNYTGYGDHKPLFLLDKLKEGFLREYQHKIVHIFLDYFPTGSDPKNGAYTDFFTKDLPGKEGLKHVRGTRKDDIFVVADADELHRREALLFLKLHDEYPEPVGVYLRRNVFGFFWCTGASLLGIACSLDMMETVYKNGAGEVRGATSMEHKFVKQLEQYKTKTGNAVQMWNMGSPSSVSNIAGWHCSWCFGPDRVRIKLLSAYNYDFPRWGDYPNKTKLNFIRKLIKVGMWFDEKSTFKPMYIGRDGPYAPPFVFKNFEKFSRLLINPYGQL